MSAWLSLVGRPSRQASVLQKTMANIAAPTVARLMTSDSTMPFPMVAATAVPKKAPKKLSTAAMMTATPGLRTRVETTVAMAFGASVQPLTNSAASTSASTTSSPKEISPITHLRPLRCGLLSSPQEGQSLPWRC
jgi:hypothetical protein